MTIRNSLRTLQSKLSIIKEYYFIINDWFASVRESMTDYPAVIFLKNLGLPQRFFSRKNPVINYTNKFFSTLIEAAILVAVTGVLSFLIYFTLGMLWYAYMGTPMADKFISLNPEKAQTIIQLAGLDLVYFCVEVTLSSFVICFTISALCQFLHISHYLYLSQGFFGKLLYWGIPLTVAVSYYIKYEYGFSDVKTIGWVAMIPTYLMFMSCFKYSQKLIPEASDVIKAFVPWVKNIFRRIFLIITYLARYLIKQ